VDAEHGSPPKQRAPDTQPSDPGYETIVICPGWRAGSVGGELRVRSPAATVRFIVTLQNGNVLPLRKECFPPLKRVSVPVGQADDLPHVLAPLRRAGWPHERHHTMAGAARLLHERSSHSADWRFLFLRCCSCCLSFLGEPDLPRKQTPGERRREPATPSSTSGCCARKLATIPMARAPGGSRPPRTAGRWRLARSPRPRRRDHRQG
jgi:hypothetical protein